MNGPQRAADAAATVCVTACGISLTQANEIAQFIAACVAIVTGLAALAVYVRKLWWGR